MDLDKVEEKETAVAEAEEEEDPLWNDVDIEEIKTGIPGAILTNPVSK
jgi:hypothetical protein